MENLKKVVEDTNKIMAGISKKNNTNYATSVIISIISDMLPTIGRDFNVGVHDDGESFSIELTSSTKVGKAFIESIREDLYKAIDNIGKK